MSQTISIIAGTLVAGMVCSTVWAQPATKSAEPVVKENIPDSEKLAKSSEYLAQMRLSLKVVIGKLQEAQSSKDIVKNNCVKEKLNDIKGLLRISEQSGVTLQEAVAKHDESLAEHEFIRLSIARQKVEQLRTEGEQCVGMLAYETGPTEVIVQEPADLPSNDPTQSPIPGPVVSRPPPASPIL